MEFTAEARAAVEKVEKLLALARDRRGNENEAQVALDMAHRILEAHNLDMALIERRTGQKTHARREDKTTGGGLYKWQREVWEATAKLNMCMYFSIRGTARGSKYENRVIGRTENVLMTKLMAEYLQDTIERLAAEWAKDRGYNSRFVREAIIYREGMAAAVSSRLRDLQWERKEEERERAEARPMGDGTSLVLGDILQTEADLNRDYINGLEPGTTAARRAASRENIRQYEEQQAKRQAEHDAKMLSDPEYAAAWLKAQAERAKADAAWGKKGQKKQARSRAVYRETNEDRRRQSTAFVSGYHKGRDIGQEQPRNTVMKNKVHTRRVSTDPALSPIFGDEQVFGKSTPPSVQGNRGTGQGFQRARAREEHNRIWQRDFYVNTPDPHGFWRHR